MANQHGYCPHCKVSLDGGYVIDTFLDQGVSQEGALEIAKHYDGWEKYGTKNQWCRAIGIYDLYSDRTTSWKCPDCNKEWST